jgi:hypothetical protein
MANQTGIVIVIKAFLPTGKTLDEQFAALSLVKEAHENGDYSELLQAAKIAEVKTEQKTRRIEHGLPGVVPAIGLLTGDSTDQGMSESEPEGFDPETEGSPAPETDVSDKDVPNFLKGKGKRKAA